MSERCRWRVADDYQKTPAAEVFSSLEKVFSITGERINSDSISSVTRVEIAGTGYYVKRYIWPGTGLRRLMGRSRVRAEWENMLFFHKTGIPAAKVAAYGLEKKSGWFIRGAIITEEFRNSKDLKTMANEQSGYLQDKEWVHNVIDQVANAAKTLHAHRFIHTDLKWRNILVTQEKSPRIALIDCPSGCFKIGRGLERGKIKDLACLDKVGRRFLSRTERLYFLKRYLSNENSGDMRFLIKKITHYFSGRD